MTINDMVTFHFHLVIHDENEHEIDHDTLKIVILTRNKLLENTLSKE